MPSFDVAWVSSSHSTKAGHVVAKEEARGEDDDDAEGEEGVMMVT